MIGGFQVGPFQPIPAFQQETSQVVTPPSGGGGGGTGIYYQGHRHPRRKLNDEIGELVAKVAYEKLLESQPSSAVKAEAAAVVRPFAKSDAATPAVAAVNWKKLEADAAATSRIISLWLEQNRRIQAEEEWFMMGD